MFHLRALCLRHSAFAALLCTAMLPPSALSEILRFAAQGDIATLDPHAKNDRFNNAMVQHLYEPLALRGPDLKVIPGLALTWVQVPQKDNKIPLWRVTLRPSVTFHEGQPFTADDVVFSITRAQSPQSHLQSAASSLGRVRRIDATTVEFDTMKPNPLFIETLTLIPIMSQAWAKAHGAEQPGNLSANQETYAHRHANGTGPLRNAVWKPDISLTMDANSNLWARANEGKASGGNLGNVTQVLFTPLQSVSTRVAALATGAVDLVVDLSPNDRAYLASNKALKTVSGLENRIIYFGFDVKSPHLRHGTLADNPLQKSQVRQALWQAIDYATLQKQVLKGDHLPTGAMVTALTTGYDPALNTLPRYDPTAARAQLAQACYPNGFTLGLNCPSDRHPVDEVLCKAVTNFWSKVGVQARLRLQPKTQYFAELEKTGADVFLMGWGGATTDAMYSLKPLVHSAVSSTNGTSSFGSVAGKFNYGGIVDPSLDVLIDKAEIEQNPALRKTLLLQALQKVKQEAYVIPLFQQAILWGMQSRINAVPRADNRLEIFRVQVETSAVNVGSVTTRNIPAQ